MIAGRPVLVGAAQTTPSFKTPGVTVGASGASGTSTALVTVMVNVSVSVAPWASVTLTVTT